MPGLIGSPISQRLPPATGPNAMTAKTPAATARVIAWPSVITVVSAAILIGAEVFGAAFAGGWAIAILFGLGETSAHIVQVVLFLIGVAIMISFVRGAQRIEPFVRKG
jgi:hypothetical protein